MSTQYMVKSGGAQPERWRRSAGVSGALCMDMCGGLDVVGCVHARVRVYVYMCFSEQNGAVLMCITNVHINICRSRGSL